MINCCQALLSSFAVKCNLRRYVVDFREVPRDTPAAAAAAVVAAAADDAADADADADGTPVDTCEVRGWSVTLPEQGRALQLSTRPLFIST